MNDPHIRRPDGDAAADAPTLSPDGVARRKAMLNHLVDEMQRVHSRRRARRRIAIAIVPVMLGAVTVAIAISRRAPQPTDTGPLIVQQPPHVEQPPAARPSVLITYVSDDELLEELAALNRPTGLVRTGDKVWLTRQVTDESSDPPPFNNG